MKNVKLSLFVTALTLAIAIPTGVYAQGRDSKSKSVEHKIESKTAKTQEWDAKFVENHKNNVKLSESKVASKDEKNKEWSEKFAKNHENEDKSKDIKVELTVEQKAALEVKKVAIKKLTVDNKVLQTSINANKEAIKAELERIEAAKLVIPEDVKTQIDAVIHPEDVVMPVPVVDPAVVEAPVVVPVVDPAIDQAPVVVPVVDPAIDQVPAVVPVVDPAIDTTPVVVPVVEMTYFEKIQAKLDKLIVDLTTKNTELTDLSTKILNILNALKLIQL